ncbi:MAG: hypothetical protein LBH68_08950, partial [Bifidobacteriaceae bacterium]|nr:hypothetical protein [Bifidobacteriaceae bacterium]
MSKRPPSTAVRSINLWSRLNRSWVRPTAMLAAGAAALAGMVLAQGLTAAQQAAAAGPPPSAEHTTASVTPTPDREAPKVAANGISGYRVDVTAMGLPEGGGAPQPSSDRQLRLTLKPLEGQPSDGAFFPALGNSYEADLPTGAAGELSVEVAANQAGAYLLEVSDGQAALTPVWAQELYFAVQASPEHSFFYSEAWNGINAPIANWGNPEAAYQDYHSVEVFLADNTGQPLEGGDPPLSIAAAPGDPFDGAGLVFANGGSFQCKLHPWSGACDPGWFEIQVYASRAGQRQVEITYGEPGSEGSFNLHNRLDPGSTALTLDFAPDWRLDWSTLVVSPSDPVDDPNDPASDPSGVPLPVPVGTAYQITYTAWDEGRTTRTIWGHSRWQALAMELTGDECHAAFPAGGTATAHNVGTDGQFRDQVVSNQPGVCELVVEGQEPRTLVWVDPEVGTDVSRSWFSVSPDAVVAGGVDQGSVEVQLTSADGVPITQAAALLEARPPAGSGISVAQFVHDGGGRYLASFTGVEAGEFPLEVSFNGTPIGIQPGVGNSVATFVEAGSPPSPAKSRVTVTRFAGQKANHDAPASTVREWGRQSITATLKDADGNAVAYGAGSLVAAAAPGDLLGGIGLYFGNGGLFACQEAPVDGACASGVYVLPVYSSKAGERQLTVTYLPGGPDQVLLVNGDQPSSRVLRTVFTVPPASPAYSTLVVSPSLPADDPDDPLGRSNGRPQPLEVSAGERYVATVTLWDEGRNNRVPNEQVELGMYHSDDGTFPFCLAQIDGTDDWGGSLLVTTSASGRAQVEILSEYATRCGLHARLDNALASELQGAPKNLEWVHGEPFLDGGPNDSGFYVEQDNVPAEGATAGRVAVQLVDAYSYAEGISGRADQLALVAPAGSGIEVRGISESEGAGYYRIHFTGTVPGDHPLQVTYMGQPLTARTEGWPDPAAAVAHMVPGDEPNVSAANSRMRLYREGDEGQAGRRRPPGMSNSEISGIGRPVLIYVGLKNDAGESVQDLCSALSWAPDPDDPLGGAGLFDQNGGMFETENRVGCTASIHSTEPGERRITVTYRGRAVEFDLATEADPAATVLTLNYRAPGMVGNTSTMVVTPSLTVNEPDDPDDPLNQPDDLAAPILAGQNYQVVVTGWDHERRRRAGASDYEDLVFSLFGKDGGHCSAFFVDPDGPEDAPGGSAVYGAKLDENGRAVLDVRALESTTCYLSVYGGAGATPRELAGSPQVLRWLASDIDVSHPGTWYNVSPEGVVFGGFDHGTVTIQAKDSDGNPVDDAAEELTAMADQDAGISVTSFRHVGGGLYEAEFSGRHVGSYYVAAYGVNTINLKEDGNPFANIVAPSAPPGGVDVAQSWLIQPEGRAAANGVSELVVGAKINDTNGDPVEDVEVLFEIPEQVCAAVGPCQTGPILLSAPTDDQGVARLSLVSPYLETRPAEGIRVRARVDGDPLSRVKEGEEPSPDLVDQPGFALLGFDARRVASGAALSRLEWSGEPGPVGVPQTVTAWVTDQDGIPFDAARLHVSELDPALRIVGDLLPDEAAAISLPSTGTGGINVVSDTAGRYELYWSLATVEVSYRELSHSIMGFIGEGMPAVLEFEATAPPRGVPVASESWLVQHTGTAAANGVSELVVEARVNDAYGEPVEGADVWFRLPTYVCPVRASDCDSQASDRRAVTDADGRATLRVVNEYLAATPADGLQVAGRLGTPIGEQLFNVRTPEDPETNIVGQAGAVLLRFEAREVASGPDRSRFEWLPQATDVGVPQAVTVWVVDQDGVPFQGAQVAVGLPGPSLSVVGDLLPDAAHLVTLVDGYGTVNVDSSSAGVFSLGWGAVSATVAHSGQSHVVNGVITEGAPVELEFRVPVVERELDLGQSTFELVAPG